MTESDLLSYIHNILYDNDKWGGIMTTDNTREELKKLLEQYYKEFVRVSTNKAKAGL